MCMILQAVVLIMYLNYISSLLEILVTCRRSLGKSVVYFLPLDTICIVHDGEVPYLIGICAKCIL